MPSKPVSEYRFEELRSRHDRQSFSCGIDALDQYFIRQAGQDRDRGTATVFCMTQDGVCVDGFYTLSAQSILATGLPPQLARGMPSRNQIGVTLLGRMAVRRELQGRGLGKVILANALRRAWRTSQEVASWAVVVDAKEGVRQFYIHHGFIDCVDLQGRMFLSMKAIGKLVNP